MRIDWRSRTDAPVRKEQIDALFKNVAWGVVGATIGAAVLAIVLTRLGVVATAPARIWTAYIAAGASCHLLLRRERLRSPHAGDKSPIWPILFSLIALAEGLGWGWATVYLVKPGHVDATMLAVTVTLSISAASISAFSSYLPAFYSFFMSATLPYLIASIWATSPVERESTPLMLIYMIGVGGLGFATNRSFRELVGLRLQTANLARDLTRQKDIAETANLAKSSFLAAASHDLRQPVHALGLFVGALRGVAMSTEGVRLVEQIEASTAAMDGLFSALLDISRLDAGVVKVCREVFPIQPLISRICREFVSEVGIKGITLNWRASHALVDTDPVLLERILRNLISNAVRYTESGGVLVGCRCGALLRIEVWDTGPGIPPDKQEQVFQEYFQLSNPERDRSKGLGLGLAIVRRLADLLNCELSLNSRPGRGSRFSVHVPLASAAMSAAANVDGDGVHASARGLVVVIDDEVAIREAMSVLLCGWGYDVVTAASGDEARARLAERAIAPSLIVCDYRLAGEETGVDVVARLRETYHTVPAMLITGDTAPDRLVEAQSSGLLLLHKPVPNGKLRAAITNLTQGERNLAESESLER